MKRSTYIGRFAPSPTGPLHMGSLVAALGSYLDARLHGGKWLVRMEDIDTPRCMPSAAEHILQTLQALELHWDDEVTFQSQRHVAYQQAFDVLQQQGNLYPCACTRKEIADSLPPHQRHHTPIYPGTCRTGLTPDKHSRPHAWRVHSATQIIFHDHALGQCTENLAEQVGDFVIKRADGLWAYQLAVVVDDAACGVTHVVRGADLLTSTARQIHLQHLLNMITPQYWHLPLVLGEDGEKLSKQNQAQALSLHDPLATLNQALQHIGLPSVAANSMAVFWPQALQHWELYRLNARKAHA